MSYGPPFQGYGPPPGAPPPNPMNPYPPPNPMNPMGPMGSPPRNHGLAVASMVCGILAIVPGCCCGLFGIPLSIAALIMGLISIGQINASGGQLGGKGMAIAGTACGAVAVSLNIVGVFLNVTSEVMKHAHV